MQSRVGEPERGEVLLAPPANHPADDDIVLGWVRETAARLDRHRCEGVHVDFVSEREGRVAEAYTRRTAGGSPGSSAATTPGTSFA